VQGSGHSVSGVPHQHLLEGAEGKHERSFRIASQPRAEPSASQVQSCSAIHSARMFGHILTTFFSVGHSGIHVECPRKIAVKLQK
jgi:hypothetical protein